MKSLVVQLSHFLRKESSRKDLRSLARLLIVLAAMVLVYSVIFHQIMLREDRDYSWFTGIYWTLTTMSTLGFGDITFRSDLGRVFSMFVLLTGTIYMLILLPFSFIRFFYAPWMEAHAEARALRRVPVQTSGHVVLTHHDAVTSTLIKKLNQYHYPYTLVIPTLADALRLHDTGLNVVMGTLDNPDVYRKLQVEKAAMVVTTASDPINTHVAFTVRELTSDVPIIATADDPASEDILELAGCSFVLQISEMLGQSLARRMHSGESRAHVIGRYGEVLIAEATAVGTPMVGKSLQEIGLRRELGLTVAGVWERGLFKTALPQTRVSDKTILVLAGVQEQLEQFDETYRVYRLSEAPAVIIGGGRVGRATARALDERGLDYCVVEQNADRASKSEKCVQGNAAELTVLQQAGIEQAPAAIITTHDDDMNVYLTVYCRRLRPDVQIISRASAERNVRTLHRAGADIVMSYASMGASSILNLLKRGKTLLLAEGLNILRVPVPQALRGKTLAELLLRERTGCAVVAIRTASGMEVIPDPHKPLPEAGELLLIGASEAENRFLELYGGAAEQVVPGLDEVATTEA